MPSTRIMPASDGPAPRGVPGCRPRPAPRSSAAAPTAPRARDRTTPASSSALPRPGGPTGSLLNLGVELFEVLVQDPLLQLVPDRGTVDLPVLAPEVAPRLVRGEDHPVVAH